MKRIRGFGRKLLSFAERQVRHKVENSRLGSRLKRLIERGEVSCGGICLCSTDCPFRRDKSDGAVTLVVEVIEDVRCGIYSQPVRAVLRQLEFHQHRDEDLPNDSIRLERTLARRVRESIMTEKPVSILRALSNQIRELRRSDP